MDQAFQQSAAQEVQESRYQTHPWEQVIHDYIDSRTCVSVQQIMECTLSIPKEKWDQRAKNTIAACLKRLGWEGFQRKVKPGEAMELKVSGGTSGLVKLYRPKLEDREPGGEG